MKYRVLIEQDEDGYFVAEAPSLPGCISQGATRQEALDRDRRGLGVAQLPVVPGREAVKAFAKLGYVADRQRGSHIILRQTIAPHRRPTVPVIQSSGRERFAP